jgi:hypothetical protein
MTGKLVFRDVISQSRGNISCLCLCARRPSFHQKAARVQKGFPKGAPGQERLNGLTLDEASVYLCIIEYKRLRLTLMKSAWITLCVLIVISSCKKKQPDFTLDFTSQIISPANHSGFHCGDTIPVVVSYNRWGNYTYFDSLYINVYRSDFPSLQWGAYQFGNKTVDTIKIVFPCANFPDDSVQITAEPDNWPFETLSVGTPCTIYLIH